MTFVRHPGSPRGPRPGARGSVLVEFALVSLAFYLLLAAVVAFGMQLHTAQVAQDAARLGARELALTSLPAGISFEDALVYENPSKGVDVRGQVYDPDALVINLDNLAALGATTVDEYFAKLPSLNRALRPLMIYDQVYTSNTNFIRVLRAPGAVIRSTTPPAKRKAWYCGYSVAVPSVLARDADGRETIEWLPVVEEVRVNRSTPVEGPFSVLSTGPDRGLVALRINVPVQSSAMAAFKPAATPFETNGDEPILADDAGVTESNSAPGTPAGIIDVARPMNDGRYGLGRVQALGKELRPYRRLISAQALFRREVFAEQSQ